MRISKTFVAASLVAIAASTAIAGGLSPEVMEAPVVVVEPAMAATSSLPAGYVVLGLLAALVAASGSF